MNTLLFLLFCLAIGYVCIWVLVNERRGNPDGDWGVLAMRKPKRASDDAPDDVPAPPDRRGVKT